MSEATDDGVDEVAAEAKAIATETMDRLDDLEADVVDLREETKALREDVEAFDQALAVYRRDLEEVSKRAE